MNKFKALITFIIFLMLLAIFSMVAFNAPVVAIVAIAIAIFSAIWAVAIYEDGLREQGLY